MGILFVSLPICSHIPLAAKGRLGLFGDGDVAGKGKHVPFHVSYYGFVL